jgi:hypothetical protein
MIRNNLSASELNHPKTQEYFHQINHLLELFNQTNSEKDIAEWDYSFLNNTVEQNKEFNNEEIALSSQEKGSNDDEKQSEDSKSNMSMKSPQSDLNSSKFYSEYILQNNSKQNEEFIVSWIPFLPLFFLAVIVFFSKL